MKLCSINDIKNNTGWFTIFSFEQGGSIDK